MKQEPQFKKGDLVRLVKEEPEPGAFYYIKQTRQFMTNLDGPYAIMEYFPNNKKHGNDLWRWSAEGECLPNYSGPIVKIHNAEGWHYYEAGCFELITPRYQPIKIDLEYK